MIYGQDNIAFKIFDIFSFDGSGNCGTNYGRSFDALSFRYKTDAVIESGGNEIELRDGSVCFFPANISYLRTAKKDLLIVVHFKVFNYHASSIEPFFPDAPDKYSALFQELLECWNKKSTAYKHEAAAVLNRIFAELYKDNEPKKAQESRIYPSLKYVEENYLKKDFSLHTAAEKSSVSDTYFRKLFKAELKVSPKKYVINCRMKYAASLILAGYFSLQEIAEMCGYDDYKHFSSEFKKNMLVSPSNYKYRYVKDDNVKTET